MTIFGGGCWSFINVAQNPDDYTFELDVDYEGNDLNGMQITKSPDQPKSENAVSINDVKY